MLSKSDFLPTSCDEMEALGWDQADIIIFSGDAYVDHPSFGAAVIGRTLQKAGYRVAIVPQPNWRDDLRDFKNLLKNLYPDVPVIAGGIEASLRRVAHYDYWEDRLRPSILLDAPADMVTYGMGERTILEIASRLERGEE